jgi:hypothetical protein
MRRGNLLYVQVCQLTWAQLTEPALTLFIIQCHDRHVKAGTENSLVLFSDPVNMHNIKMYLEFLSRNYRYGRPEGFPKFIFSVEGFCLRCISHVIITWHVSHTRAGHRKC